MSFKGIFSQSQKNNENRKMDINDFEQQNRRINTLEVHVTRLLKLESKLGPISSFRDRQTAESKIPLEQRSEEMELIRQIHSLKLRIDKISQKVTSIEQITFQQSSPKNNQKFFSSEIQTKKSTRNDYDYGIERYIDQIIEQKLSPYLKQVEYCNEKLIALERNISLINEIQLDVLKRMSAIREEFSDLHQRQVNEENSDSKQTIVLKELYIDKFYLEKYEQNNNIAQVGIKELSGALNIGATYGNSALPCKTSAELKKEMDEHKIEDEAEQKEDEFSSKDDTADSSESSLAGEIFYTDIPIDGPGAEDNN